jgi:hypothetical protein
MNGQLTEFVAQITRQRAHHNDVAFSQFRNSVSQRFNTRFRDFAEAVLREQRERRVPFNVFGLLRLERDEAVHSRFLAELLNPSGSHGAGPWFLNAFLEQCRKLANFPRLLERRVRD